jgi:hypothetical protein
MKLFLRDIIDFISIVKLDDIETGCGAVRVSQKGSKEIKKYSLRTAVPA